MPKAHAKKPLGKFHSSKRSNATGYANRLKQKSTPKKPSLGDVYEFEEESKVRRSKVKLDLEREEEAGFGQYGSDDEGPGFKNAKLIGIDGDEERIASDDDEEIDSDAAFEESDEDRFAGFTFQSTKRKPKSTHSSRKNALPEVDLNEEDSEESQSGEEADEPSEEEEEEEEGDSSEFIDVLDFFEGRRESEDTPDQPSVEVPMEEENYEESSDEENDQDDEETGEDIVMSASDEEADSNALDGLGDFITSLSTELPSKKRKADEVTSEIKPPKRRLLKEKTEAGPESEFRVQSSGSKLQLDDLLGPLASQSSNLTSLQKSVKILAPAKTLSAPLPQRVQERLDREAAYEQTKNEVDKWSATMKRIREAEHLSFPLQAQAEPRVSNLELTAKFKPTTKLETSVDKLLKLAQLRDEDIEKMEDQGLKAQNLTLEEVADRRAELRKMRELMFRAEAKAKRVAKIKSKTYRRLRKKERAKLAEQDDDAEETEEGRLKMEVERARERATLKHRSTGKWAMELKRKGELGVDQRRDLEEMLRRGERLKQKIQGVESGEDEVDEDEMSNVELDISRIKQDAFDELARLDGEEAPDTDFKAKSVFKMKFMQDAMARQNHEADRIADDFVKEMGGEEICSGSETGGPVQDSENVQVSRTGGRAVFRPGANQLSIGIRTFNSLASDTSSVTLKSTDLQTTPPHSAIEQLAPSPAVSESNPWLARAETSSAKVARKKNEIVVNKDSNALAKSKNKLNKQERKREMEKERREEDANVEIQLNDSLALSTAKNAPKPSLPVEENESDSEIEGQETLTRQNNRQKSKGPKAFEQRDLVALAFAGDNVVQSFEDQKRREIAEDAPREVDTTLPGWGSWGGRGTTRAPLRPHLIKQVAGINPKSRADFGKSHVIISEKRDKKAAKYQVKDLPFPYTSKAQYDRSMEMPVGAEWNTRVGFQKATMPKVLKKPGTIISPLEKLS